MQKYKKYKYKRGDIHNFFYLCIQISNNRVLRMTRKCLMAAFVCMWLIACTDGGKQGNTPADELMTDSLEAETDSLSMASEEVMPMGADELFDDFFFNYASSLKQQRERTVFPLSVIDATEGNKASQLEKKDWKLERFFMKDDYYTLLFDSQSQMDLASDTTVMRVTVERFAIEENKVEQFVFSRKSGQWMLHEIRYQTMAQNPNAQFLKFYERFATDSAFQKQSLAEQIQFSGPDPDDDFSTIDGVITPDFWEAFRPDLPSKKLYNIVYGRQNPASIEKIFMLRGIANGLEVEMTFKLRRGHWKLTKLTT